VKKKDKKPEPKMTYKELVDYVTRRAFDALITTGGAGLRGIIYIGLSDAIRWSEDQDK
jgi:hypothetical protein